MLVYRVGTTRYATDLSGEGARLNGGRWNNEGTPCIYTAQSRALAVLEYTVNISIDDIPRALSITTFDIPDRHIIEVSEAGLPGNWKGIPTPSDTRMFGTHLLRTGTEPVIRIPSSIIPREFNYLLNPAHPGAGAFSIVEVQDFVYDVRIKMA